MFGLRCSLPTLVVAALAGALPASATPTITRIDPPGATRGSEATVTIGGGDLADPQEVFFPRGVIAVSEIVGKDGKTLTARLRVPADCPLGNHFFRVRTKDGLSELRSFRVGLLEQVAEAEPNNDPAEAQETTLPRTVRGVIGREDVDCFRVHLPAGGRLSAAVDAIRLDQEMFDPHLEVVDADGFVVAACDDHPLLGQDAMLAVTVAEEGDYVLRLRESAYGGNDGSLYLLHLGDFPVPHLAWPPAGPPGGELEVTWLGDPAGPFTETITLPEASGPDGLAEIYPARDGINSPVPVPIRISPLPMTPEAEGLEGPTTAVSGTAPVALLGRLEKPDDVDWFRVEAPKGSKWHVRGWGRRLGSPVDLVVNLYRDTDKRERITGNDDAGGPDSEAQLTVPEEGAFLVRVNDHQQRGGPDFAYWIEVEPVAPSMMVSVPVGRSNTQERLVAVVPRGNRTALVLNTARSDFRDPAQIALDGLPAGVTATVPLAAGNAPATLALFEAAADAAPATAMAAVTVTTADGQKPLGGLRQKTDLVFGQPNNAVYRTAETDRLPVAVVEPAPLRIELEQPAVPLVRGGTLELRVTVERREGFEGGVRLFLPFTPPGLGSRSSVEIPADKSEGIYAISANPDAPLGEWQLAVTGLPRPVKNGRGDGEMLLASGLVTVRVAEPMVELAAESTTAEQGQETRIVWTVKKPAGFTGAAKARLMGLPAKVEAPALELPADATELAFPVTVGPEAPPGHHKNVFLELQVPLEDAWVTHATPHTTLRVDKPLPPEEPAEKK